MAHTTVNTVMVTGTFEKRAEALANASLYPGQLIELMSTAKVRKHATAGGSVYVKMVAVEDDLQGNTIDTQYAASALVQYVVPQPGDIVCMYLKDGETVSIGDPLESDGAGDLQKFTADVASDADSTPTTIYGTQVVGIAKEAVDLSSSAVEAYGSRRILVQIA